MLQSAHQWRAAARRQLVDRFIDQSSVGIQIDYGLIEFATKVVTAERADPNPDFAEGIQ